MRMPSLLFRRRSFSPLFSLHAVVLRSSQTFITQLTTLSPHPASHALRVHRTTPNRIAPHRIAPHLTRAQVSPWRAPSTTPTTSRRSCPTTPRSFSTSERWPRGTSQRRRTQRCVGCLDQKRERKDCFVAPPLFPFAACCRDLHCSTAHVYACWWVLAGDFRGPAVLSGQVLIAAPTVR